MRWIDVGVVAALADRHRHPAPVGIGAVDGGLDERRVDDRLGHPLRLVDVAGSVDVDLDQRLGALAVGGDRLGEGECHLLEGHLERGRIDRARPHHWRGSTAVSLVDVSVSTLTQLNVRSTTRRNVASSSSAPISASVVITAIIVAMSGSIIPTPLAMPTTTAAAGGDRCGGELGHGVGGHHRLRGLVDGVERQRARGSRRCQCAGDPSGSADRSHRWTRSTPARAASEPIGRLDRRSRGRRRARPRPWRRWRSSTR